MRFTTMRYMEFHIQQEIRKKSPVDYMEIELFIDNHFKRNNAQSQIA